MLLPAQQKALTCCATYNEDRFLNKITLADKSNYTKTLDKLQNLVHKELKVFGFSKKGRTHNKVVDEGIVHVINFQSGEFPVGDNYIIPGFRESYYGKFTINLGVFVSDIYEITQGQIMKDFIPEYICQIRTRLPELTNNNDDWWTVDDNYIQIAEKIAEELITVAFKWFDNFSNRDKIIKNLQNKRIKNLYSRIGKLNAALIQIKIDRSKGEALLREHYNLRSDHKPHQEYVIELAKKVGVVI